MPKPLSDVYIRHGINLTRYSNYEAQRLIKLLDTANTQIKGIITKAKAVETKEKYRRVAAEIERVTKECGEQLNGQVEADFKGLAEAETAFTAKALRGAGVKADFTLPSAAKVWSAASFGSYADGHETFETYLNGLSENMFKTWDTQVRAGYLTGMTAKEINRAVLGTADGLNPGEMQALRRSLERNTKTMVASMAETARDAVYKANSKLFSGYRYVGVLDSRQCLVCGSSDGVVFKEIEDGPKLPQHVACRCLYLPLVKGMEDFDDDDTRASADGPVSANMTYSDWLKTQPEGVQRDILGPARFEMYKQGEPISGFVADGRVMTLKQLREAEGINGFQWTQEKVAEMESTLRKSDDIFSNLSYDEAKSLANEIRTNYPDKARFARDVEDELERLERSEKFTQMIRDNGIDIPKSNIKIDIEPDMYKELMADPSKWIEYVKQAEPLDNGWGYADKDNRFAQAIIFVNGGEYRPIDKYKMMYDFKGYTDVGKVAVAFRSKHFADENVSKIDVSEILRAERQYTSLVTQLKEGDTIPLTGVTAFSANEKHFEHYAGGLRSEIKERVVVKYHLELTDDIRKRAMFLQLDDCALGNTDWSKPSEIVLSGKEFVFVKSSPGKGVYTYANGQKEEYDIIDVWVKLK